MRKITPEQTIQFSKAHVIIIAKNEWTQKFEQILRSR